MPRMTDHLRWHRGQWQVRAAIPLSARAALGGKTCLLHSLGTSDLKAANRLKGAVITSLKSRIAEALSPGDGFMKEARLIRCQLDGSHTEEAEDTALMLAQRLGDKIEAAQQGSNAADSAAYRIAIGFSAP
jgi:hypothetical protein